ncbi:hypothetical protein D5086_017298 [Populus alba]|uniref:Uncharacterized protein n=1 Tax=Populus alba TaxID=43335 RepID=A0ACC4BY66_POPAL
MNVKDQNLLLLVTPLNAKRSKIAAFGAKCTTKEEAAPTVVTIRRQYVIRSRATAVFDGTPIEKQKLKDPSIVLLTVSSSTAPSSTF